MPSPSKPILNPEKTIRSLQKALPSDRESLSPEISALLLSLLEILSDSITHKNALQILKLTVQYDLEDLQNQVLAFIAPNFDVFYSFREILEFADKQLIKRLLQRNDLKYDELRIYIELSDWVQRHETERWLLDLVRLPLIEPDQLMGRVVKEGLVTRERALEALVYAMGRRLGVDVESYMDLVGERFSPRSPGKIPQTNFREAAEGFLEVSHGSAVDQESLGHSPQRPVSNVRDDEDADNDVWMNRSSGTNSARRESSSFYTVNNNTSRQTAASPPRRFSRESSPPPSHGAEALVSPKELSSNYHRRHEEYAEGHYEETERDYEHDEVRSSDSGNQSQVQEPEVEHHHHHDRVAEDLAEKIDLHHLPAQLSSPFDSQTSPQNSPPHKSLTVNPGTPQFRSPHRLTSASSSATPQKWDVSFSPTQFWHQSPRKTHRYKIVIAGDSETGKSSWVENLLARFDVNKKTHIPTVGVSIHKIAFYTTEDYAIDFELWDIGGLDASSGLRDGYYLNAEGAILFFDVTNSDSYRNVLKWKKEILNVCGHSVSMVTVGTNIDQHSRRQVHLPADEPDAFMEMSITGDRQDTMYRPLEKLARFLEANRTLEFQMEKKD
mmetsp:Transcript_5517/g.20728  ORF Transcript_5517/g.20728 Transcript_5517/m.20728 type:complete len:610 (-) Transcript_5517:90-1919(-)|eukprot:CAMPEP_0117451796 /NCGR_PEP_ID=MMETSP0759-20121206/9212_1 /TAXON_ID=63605 /ORGANISM="Percolomonas cosmopolitus, Strain WS" /LENGTH=609 /DNA_ID=CAMNT_0005244447 /DNA_START=176 /DNA_END=2005 /DNA_ORIENTATION=+